MRAFLGLPLSDSAREAWARIVDSLRPTHPCWRFVRPETLHLTLRFLGEVTDEGLARAEPLWRTAAATVPSVRASLSGLGVFPSTRAPRVLWVGLSREEPPGGLLALAAAIEPGAVAAGAVVEDRPFRPHLTLARAVRGSRPAMPPSETLGAEWEIVGEEVVLYRSDLAPAGARHVPISRYPTRASGT